jgi:hypothetical protein
LRSPQHPCTAIPANPCAQLPEHANTISTGFCSVGKINIKSLDENHTKDK